MLVQDLGLMPYRDAWAVQEAAHAEALDGGPERLLLVEHPPVVTFGRRAGVEKHLLASADRLAELGVEVVQSDRGGDITFHGPGQLVVYPIVRLLDHRLSVGGYVRLLETSVIAALAAIGVSAERDACAVGVWTRSGGGPLAKLCALGVRVRRGVTLHGLALNVSTDLSHFNLIVPCGLAGRPVTSLQKLLGDATPGMERVKQVVTKRLMEAIADPERAVASINTPAGKPWCRLDADRPKPTVEDRH